MASKGTVLIAEDNKMLNEILVRIVSSCGYQTVSAFDGAQAVAVMMQTRVDMVLMDVCMPNVDGLTATREIRRLGCMIPVIACTAAIDPPTCAAAGCNDWISKPFTRDLIASVLHKWSAASPGALQYQQDGQVVSLSPSLLV